MDNCTCWLCGRNGRSDPLDEHHIFNGAFRSKSDRYGLTVRLCHNRCHLFGREAVHQNRETMGLLKEFGQRKAMAENDWTVEDFIREFGKNYLSVEEDPAPVLPAVSGEFFLVPEPALPY